VLKYSWNSIGYSLIMVTDLIMAGNLINAYVPPGVLLALMLCLEFVFSFSFFSSFKSKNSEYEYSII